MGIPGIDSILYKPGAEVWPGEQSPAPHLVELIDGMNGVIDLDLSFDLDQEIDEMARMALEPSQDMRLRYFQAYLLRDNSAKRDFKQAYHLFDHAQVIADDHSDLDSQIVLTDQQALMLYGLGKYFDAMVHYQIALEIWQERQNQLTNPPVEPAIHFHERIGMTQFYIGDFDAAAGSLARVLTLYNQRPEIARSQFFEMVSAHALWTLGLTHRAQSDMQDGSESLLLSAVERMGETIDLFKKVSGHEHDIARIHIQMAETLLDLSDLYLQKQQDKQAKDARASAWRHITVAQSVQYFRDSEDPSGRLLTALTQLRHQIVRLPDNEAIREVDDFDRQLRVIEIEAYERKVPAVIAQAAAVRGEWLLWLGDAPRARESFRCALEIYSVESMGEMTRVQRLLRRSNNEARPQRVKRTRATGPRVSHPRLSSLPDEPREPDAP